MSAQPINPDGVYFLDFVCEYVGISRRTADRLRRHRAFPIRELDKLDKRPRYSGQAILDYVRQQHGRSLRRAS